MMTLRRNHTAKVIAASPLYTENDCNLLDRDSSFGHTRVPASHRTLSLLPKLFSTHPHFTRAFSSHAPFCLSVGCSFGRSHSDFSTLLLSSSLQHFDLPTQAHVCESTATAQTTLAARGTVNNVAFVGRPRPSPVSSLS
ncbi:hypothetical protein E2C01_034308 [Portunus trituberculatus]|uniref:Uncharacterized protein n=1 Tax=Portunus trituberculatus TaxID=210409 RepID=A0A5B7F2I1_PORTR|nr:hypothetical protein [Portunus trituberculatus]